MQKRTKVHPFRRVVIFLGLEGLELGMQSPISCLAKLVARRIDEIGDAFVVLGGHLSSHACLVGGEPASCAVPASIGVLESLFQNKVMNLCR